jgi:hypothetical protein
MWGEAQGAKGRKLYRFAKSSHMIAHMMIGAYTLYAYSIIVYISVFNPADGYQSHGRVFRKMSKFGGATVEGRMNTTLEDFKGTVGPGDPDESLASHVTYVCHNYFVVISEHIS